MYYTCIMYQIKIYYNIQYIQKNNIKNCVRKITYFSVLKRKSAKGWLYERTKDGIMSI